jgi:hypothetical protein
MIEIIIIIVLGLVTVILGYVVTNLLLKIEKYEDIVTSQQEQLSTIRGIIENSDIKLREIDKRETFKSDDEIGWFFDEIKKIQNTLSQYKN